MSHFDERDFLSRFADDVEIATVTAEAFLETSADLVAQVGEQVAKRSASDAARAAHSLKGAISIFCDESLTGQLKTVELLFRQEKWAEGSEAFLQCRPQIEQVIQNLEGFLQTKKRVAS